jgi:DnaK suppressor protein
MTDERARDLLAKARADTQSRLDRIAGGPGDGTDRQEDASGQADKLVERETGEALGVMLSRRLAAIGRAEERLAAGTYGLSVLSGEPIPDGRLEIEPWAELTVAEQSAA